ncbi:MAG: flippase-like domain-containing protein [Paludibacteraceae bacterium]|nr:flippase-like domain-containing protein [Paludibacteraceae bacterium]
MKQSQRHIIHGLIALAAYGYLGWQLCHVTDWHDVATHLTALGSWQYMSLIICVLLFPLNILLEACKWRFLIRQIEPTSLLQAQKEVYYGMVGAFLTPYRVGDFPARTMLMTKREQWYIAVSLGLIGSAVLTLVIVAAGLPAAYLRLADNQHLWLWAGTAVVSVGLLLATPTIAKALAKRLRNEQLHAVCEGITSLQLRDYLIITFYSALRYLCFAVQFWLILEGLGVHLIMQDALTAIPLYYLLITLTPSMPAVDPGIRGSWAIVVFAPFGLSAPLAATAALIVWAINTILPMLVGSCISYGNQFFRE